MAPSTLAVFPLPEIHSYSGRVIACLLAIAGRFELHRCDFVDEYCDCRALATVCDLALEQELCERHFKQVHRG